MSNPVDYAIARVQNSDIDEYLLKLAFENPNANFQGNWYGQGNLTTIAQGIREQVIHRTVLPACQVNGGKTEYLDLSGSKMRSLGSSVVEINVDDVTTRGAKIISVSEVYQGTMQSAIGQLGPALNENGNCGQGVLNDMMQSMLSGLASARSMPITFNDCHMTGNNCFVVFGMNVGTYSLSAKVIMEYDEGLSSIHTHHYEEFADLVELAVKGYIYRVCKRPVSEALYRCGVPLDDIRDDIAEYKDAWKDYLDFLKKEWRPRMAWSDKELVYNGVRMAVPRRM